MRTEFARILEAGEQHKELVFEFFTVFSRFEFALKEAGFRKTYRHGIVTGVDWRAFANSLCTDLTKGQSAALTAAVSYLLEHPPAALQVEGSGNMCWTSPEKPTHTNESLFEQITRIRNNLFHGGKMPFERDRDTKLLQSALEVLSAAIDLDQRVYGAFVDGLV